MQKRIKWSAAVIIGGSFLMPLGPVGAAESGDNTPYYEDDAWYDVTSSQTAGTSVLMTSAAIPTASETLATTVTRA